VGNMDTARSLDFWVLRSRSNEGGNRAHRGGDCAFISNGL
jgi:hypothetical protein